MGELVLACALSFIAGTLCGIGLTIYVRRRNILVRPAPATEYEKPSKDKDEVAFTDPSTGLATRRYLDVFLEKEVRRSKRLHKPLSIAALDIDDFRAVRNRYGQELIERSLREAGMALRSILRDYDIIARYSEGRLLVVLPETSAEQAHQAAQRILDCLQPIKLGRTPISFSIGLASLPDHATESQELIYAAHHALNTGRGSSETNRIYFPPATPRAA
ncbi:MAG: GGDEF domain-containing protein [Armatimonadota bacterium]